VGAEVVDAEGAAGEGVVAGYCESCGGVGETIGGWGEQVSATEGEGVVWGLEGSWHFQWYGGNGDGNEMCI
jgi:hypothetical protein